MRSFYHNNRYHYTFDELMDEHDTLEDAVEASTHFFTKQTPRGDIRFVVTSLLMTDGRLVPTVHSLQHMPLLREVLDSLELNNG